MLSRIFQKALVATGLIAFKLMPGHAVVDDEMLLVLHWHPATALEARRATLASAWLLSEPAWTGENWRSVLDSRILQLTRQAERYPPTWGNPADGLFGWLARMLEQGRLGLEPEPGIPSPAPLTGLRLPPLDEMAPVLLARLHFLAARQAVEVRNLLRQRLAEFETDQQAELESLWSRLEQQIDEAQDTDGLALARDQARLVLALAGAEDEDARLEILFRLRLNTADYWMNRQAWLAGAWSLLGALVELVAHSSPEKLAGAVVENLQSALPEDSAGLRRIDSALPTAFAQLGDAAAALAAGDRARAVAEMADAYARLALFLPDAAYYLDQPVRQGIRQALARCMPPDDDLAALSREQFEACLEGVGGLFEQEIRSEELTGGTAGPYADAFLRREMALASWQRIDYLSGHLNWLLAGHCAPQGSLNVLDWSLAVDVIAWWVPKRTVYFGAPRWQEALERVREAGRAEARELTRQVDCLTGMGAVRRDPFARVLGLHAHALNELEIALRETDLEFHARHFRPGADIDLTRLDELTTAYRPESLTVGPCEPRNTCGARAQLPVSRALIGLFPSAYLLADQARLGEIELCYDRVRWVERRQLPARQRDPRVANYYGRLSFDLVGRFRTPESAETVLRLRLTGGGEHHYLFAEADPEVLEAECPHALIGTPISSELEAGGPGLVPPRLTYFVSAPVTPGNLLISNWDRGAEWRDWFLARDRVEFLELADGEDLMVAVKARLHELSSQRERLLASRLLKLPAMTESDTLVLAMSRVADTSGLLRRILEVYYPGVIRHDVRVRAWLSGEDGLLTRERVRLMRDRQMPMIEVPGAGRTRLEGLEAAWLDLPATLREQGQAAPELARGLELLNRLERISGPQLGGTVP